jgi:hypothetical protein
LLRGDEGPGGSRDHRMWIRATRVGVDRTRLELTTSLTMGRALETLTRVYLATIGRHKFGFTVVGRNGEGEPPYVRGVRGLVERAAMRQFLAFEAYLDALDVQREERFATSLRHWWRSSQRHPQLEEPSRSEYLGEQRRDRRSQVRAQSARADGERAEPRRATE